MYLYFCYNDYCLFTVHHSLNIDWWSLHYIYITSLYTCIYIFFCTDIAGFQDDIVIARILFHRLETLVSVALVCLTNVILEPLILDNFRKHEEVFIC